MTTTDHTEGCQCAQCAGGPSLARAALKAAHPATAQPRKRRRRAPQPPPFPTDQRGKRIRPKGAA